MDDITGSEPLYVQRDLNNVLKVITLSNPDATKVMDFFFNATF